MRAGSASLDDKRSPSAASNATAPRSSAQNSQCFFHGGRIGLLAKSGAGAWPLSPFAGTGLPLRMRLLSATAACRWNTLCIAATPGPRPVLMVRLTPARFARFHQPAVLQMEDEIHEGEDAIVVGHHNR